MKRFNTVFYFLFLAAMAFGLAGLRYLPFFISGNAARFSTEAAGEDWAGHIRAMLNWVVSTNPGMSADYHHVFFYVHVIAGCGYLLTAPLLLMAHPAGCGHSRRYRMLVYATLLTGFAMMPWSVYFLFFVHARYDVSWFIILTVAAIWFLFFYRMACAILAGRQTDFSRYLAAHYSISVGALFYRILYFVMDCLERGVDVPYAASLHRQHLTMAYHTAWFIALVLATILCKLLVFHFRKAGNNWQMTATSVSTVPSSNASAGT